MRLRVERDSEGVVLAPASRFAELVETSEIGTCFKLKPPVAFSGSEMEHARIVTRSTRGSLLSLRPKGAIEDCAWCELRHQGLQTDTAANDMLRLLNASWERAGIMLNGVQVATLPYAVTCVRSTAGLVEVIPGAVSLGELKRRCTKADSSLRVAEFLEGSAEKLNRLAATTAGYLASNYVLGAAGADGDNIMLAPSGELFRMDFSYLFGHRPYIDAPVVWLPQAVTTALEDMWQEVRQAAKAAFRAAMALCWPKPPADVGELRHWAHAQAMLLRIERVLGVAASRYLEDLREHDFDTAVCTADCSFGKVVKTFLHDAFGFRSKLQHQEAGVSYEPRPASCDAQVRGYTLPESLCLLVDVETWRVALCAIACLCCDGEVGSHTLEMLLWGLLSNAAVRADFTLQPRAVLMVARITGQSSVVAQSWLACFVRSCLRVECMDAIALHLRSPFAISDVALFSGDEVSPMLGLLCAVVRLAIASGARLSGGEPPESFSRSHDRGCLPGCGGGPAPSFEVFPVGMSGAMEETVARRGAVRALVTALDEGEPRMRSLVAKLVELTQPEDLAAASRCACPDEQMALLRALERLIKAPDALPAVRLWAQCCVSELAQDDAADAGLRRAAVCTIACAVHDDEPEVRAWARDFLTEGSSEEAVDGEDVATLRDPVCAVLRMASEAGSLTPRATASASKAASWMLSVPLSVDGALSYAFGARLVSTSSLPPSPRKRLAGTSPGPGSFDVPHRDSQESTDAASSEAGSASPPTSTSTFSASPTRGQTPD